MDDGSIIGIDRFLGGIVSLADVLSPFFRFFLSLSLSLPDTSGFPIRNLSRYFGILGDSLKDFRILIFLGFFLGFLELFWDSFLGFFSRILFGILF